MLIVMVMMVVVGGWLVVGVVVVVMCWREFVGDFQTLAMRVVCFVLNNCHRGIMKERGGERRVQRTIDRRRSVTRRKRRTRIEEIKIAIDVVGTTIPSVKIKYYLVARALLLNIRPLK